MVSAQNSLQGIHPNVKIGHIPAPSAYKVVDASSGGQRRACEVTPFTSRAQPGVPITPGIPTQRVMGNTMYSATKEEELHKNGGRREDGSRISVVRCLNKILHLWLSLLSSTASPCSSLSGRHQPTHPLASNHNPVMMTEPQPNQAVNHNPVVTTEPQPNQAKAPEPRLHQGDRHHFSTTPSKASKSTP